MLRNCYGYHGRHDTSAGEVVRIRFEGRSPPGAGAGDPVWARTGAGELGSWSWKAGSCYKTKEELDNERSNW